MFLVTIGINKSARNIIDDIYRQIETTKQNEMEIICEDYSVGEQYFIKCGVKDTLLSRITDRRVNEDFRFQISQVLSNTIINNWELKLVKKIIKDNYYYISEKERSNVYTIAKRLLDEERNITSDGFYKATRRNKLMSSLVEFLGTNETINIEGFVKFRLTTYVAELSNVVERAIDLFIAEREYNEFIKLLRYFVEIQECKVDVIHLKQQVDGRYMLLDGNKERINSEYLDELKSELADNDINYDDLLISTLITISPRKIFLHDMEGFRNKELVKTIKNVFSDRIEICQDCELCGAVVLSKETNNYSI